MASMQLENQMSAKEQLTANLNNQTETQIHSERYINYSKSEIGPDPPTIDAGEEVTFNGFVSKGAVVYAPHSPNKGIPGLSPAWVLAWDTTGYTVFPPIPNKVYVTCGPNYIIERMTDDEILKKLNESISPDDSHTDPITKATINANLTHSFHRGINSLKANFGQS
ncbi:uncharacterized protein LOC141647023 [Silene latifolia]|uniref:uncharacterized protein LOC141647023 n=1 Tax=Silene latifolia TaxID=37657 RepID=UPI003D774457